MSGRVTRFRKGAPDQSEGFDLDEFYRRHFQIPAPAGGKFGYNIAPTESLAFIRSKNGANEALAGRWGIEPQWVKSPDQVMGLWHNARADTASEKAAFRDAMRSARCVVPVDGLYEWQKLGSEKQPWYVYRPDEQPLLIAGLYARHSWGDSLTIITTDANSLIAGFYHRMPVILAPEDAARWLDADVTDPRLVEDLMRPCPPRWLAAHRVSDAVGNVRNDSPDLIEPI